MIELDGQEFQLRTPQENADAMVAYINEYCGRNNITNSKGEVISIDSNTSNPLYMMLFGLGYLVTGLQNLLYSAACAISIARSSTKQLLNLCDIAGIKRKAATYTTIRCAVTAGPNGDCVITTTDAVTIGNVTYNPVYDVTVPANESRNIILVASELGAFSIAAGSIAAFDSPINNIASITSFASVPGQEQETISALRARLQRRTTEGSLLERTARDIQQLPGVTLCSIFFNYRVDREEIISGIVVPVRHAMVLVQGYNNKIAETFYNHMMCPTTGTEEITTIKRIETPNTENPEQPPTVTETEEKTRKISDRAIVQNYVTRANQQIPFYIITPKAVYPRIRVYINADVSLSIENTIKQAIMNLAANMEIGKTLATATVIQAVKDVIDIDIQGAEIDDTQGNYAYKFTPAADELIAFNAEYITVTEAKVG